MAKRLAIAECGYATPREAVLPKSDAIRVYAEEGAWVVNYGSYANGFHTTRNEAIQAATDAARSEGRELVIEGAA